MQATLATEKTGCAVAKLNFLNFLWTIDPSQTKRWHLQVQ